MSFRRQIIISLAVFSIVPVLLLSAINIPIFLESSEKTAFKNLETLVRTNGIAISETLEAQAREVELASERQSIRNFLTFYANKSSVTLEQQAAIDLVARSMKRWVNSYEFYVDALVLDSEGRVLIGNGLVGMNLKDQLYFSQAIKSRETFRDNGVYHIMGETQQLMVMSHAVLDAKDKPIGVLAFFISPHYFDRFISNFQLSDESAALIVDKSGTVVAHMDESLIGYRNEDSPIAGIIDTYIIGYTPQSGIYKVTFNEKKHMMNYFIFDQLHWALVLGTPEEELYASRNLNTALAATITCLALMLAIIFSIIMTKRLTTPLALLNQAFANASERGEYTVCDVKKADEFGDLARNYNTMIQKLNLNLEELKASHERNEYLANHDSLTGLLNVVSFKQVLQEMLDANEEFGIFGLDLDNFKMVNDVYGHDMGDNLLKEFASRITNESNGLDYCARVGGDEFCLLKKGVRDTLEQTGKQLLKAFAEPFRLDGCVLHVTGSIGIAECPKYGVDVKSATKSADIAMYKSKASGKNCVSFFNDEMQNQVNREAQICETLKTCTSDGQAYMLYMPEVDLETGKVLGVEALMRINSRQLGLIPPIEFIPIAEADGSIIRIGNWVLHEACRFTRYLIDNGADEFTMSVNLSYIQLIEPTFVETVLGIIDEEGIDPRFLRLELSNNIVIRDLEAARQKLQQLSEHGITLVLDHVGASDSSYSHIIELPVKVVKVDRKYVGEMTQNRKKELLIQSIIQTAQHMGITVVGEGVETDEQKAVLMKQNCNRMQGYLFSKPLAEGQILELMDIPQV